jgi:dihydroxy-acid dehydratase
VFEDIYDLAARIDDPVVPADASSVLVLRNAGPVGAPGMPEWGMLPIPRKLLEAGVRDMVRISDARMSGTAFGTVVLHVAPESAVGGPLAVVQTGDPIVLDVAQGRLDLDIDPAELQRRLAAFVPPAPKYRRGYGSLFLDHVLQADRGCDFDFLVRQPAEPPERDPLGMVGDPIAGW